MANNWAQWKVTCYHAVNVDEKTSTSLTFYMK